MYKINACHYYEIETVNANKQYTVAFPKKICEPINNFILC